MRIQLIVLLALGACGDDGGACPDHETQVMLINPATLACEVQIDAPACAGKPPLPDWGPCDSPCTTEDEATCNTDAACRIAHDAADNSFIGCFPIGTAPPRDVPCLEDLSDACGLDTDCVGSYARTNTTFSFQSCEPKMQP